MRSTCPTSVAKAVLLAATTSLVACGSTQPSSSIDPPAFVRLQNAATVLYFSHDLASYCAVTSPAQMDAYGGFVKVRVLPASENLPDGAKLSGACGFPDGVYSMGGKIIVLSGSAICIPLVQKKPEHTVPVGTDLSVGRAPVAAC